MVLYSDHSICSAVVFHPSGNSDHALVLASIDFLLNSAGGAPLQCTAYDYCQADWDDLHSHLRDVLWHDIFQLSTSIATTKYSKWLQFGNDVCIPHQNQVVAHSSPWFSAACTGTTAHWSHFFHVYEQNDSSTSKLAHANKIKESIILQKIGSH